MADKEKSTTTLNIRIKPSVKDLALELAEAQGISVSNYIEWLILQDANDNGSICTFGCSKRTIK